MQKTPDPKNPVLDQMIDQLEASLNPQDKAAYQRIVVAGMQVLFSDKTHKFLQEGVQKGQGNLPRAAIDGVKQLLALIYKSSKGKMKIEMAFPAAITLLCLILDFIEASSGKPFTKEEVGQTIQRMTPEILKMFQIDEQKLAQGIDYARQHKDQFQEGATPQAPVAPPATGMTGTVV